MATSWTTPSHPITSIQVKITVAPSDASAFLSALGRVHAIVSALPGNISFDLYQNPEVPGEFKYIENWSATSEWILAASK
jgi:quinol monooxygenase YgiN